MSQPMFDRSAQREEREVRALLNAAGMGPAPDDEERANIEKAMWAALESPEGEGLADLVLEVDRPTEMADMTASVEGRPRPTKSRRGSGARALFWAAVIVSLLGTVGLLSTPYASFLSPAETADAGRTSFRVGDTQVVFDTVPGYTATVIEPAMIVLVSDESLRTHQTITVAEVQDIFGNEGPEQFFEASGLEPTTVTDENAETWLVAVGAAPGCRPGRACIPFARTVDGTELHLVAGSYARIEVHENGGRVPVVVLSTVGSPVSGPALPNVELRPIE